MKLIINEKPSVSKEFQKALKVTPKERTEGYIKGFSPVLNEEVIITWAVGHLVTMSYPEKYDERYKTWNVEDLPFLPKEYLYEVISNVKKQYGIVKKLFENDVEVLYAGDSGREGIYIQALIRQEVMKKSKKQFKERVVWIDSQTEDEVIRGIKEAKPLSHYQSLIDAAYERAIEDYAVGINFSRVLSVLYGHEANKRAGTKSYRPIAVGRVMTCVLGMIVEREREIENFVPTPFYKITNTIGGIEAEWKAVETSSQFNSPKLYNDTGFKAESDAVRFVQTLPEQIVIEEVERKKELKYAPLLFNLAELQNECTRRFKISPDKTLETVQSLYEKKMTTYPRTDARVLSTAIAGEVQKNIKGIAGHYEVEQCQKAAQWIVEKGLYSKIGTSKYTDDSKITDHYAIIPTGAGYDNYKSLSELEKNVYEMIVRRTLSIFLPPAEYQTVKVIEIAGTEKFYAQAKVLSNPGYMYIAGLPKNENTKLFEELGQIVKGMSYPASYSIKKGETTPPKHYTSGSMILAMENVGNLIEEEELRAQIKGAGIGTSATRAEVIKKLKNLEYITINSKTQVLGYDTLGLIIYEIVKETIPELLNPKMTASWELGLDQITHQQITSQKYRETLEQYIIKIISKVKNEKISLANMATKEQKSILCPLCGKEVREGQKNFYCLGYKDEPKCKMVLWKEFYESKITANDAAKVLTGQTIKKKIKSKEGKEWEQVLMYDKEACKLKFVKK